SRSRRSSSRWAVVSGRGASVTEPPAAACGAAMCSGGWTPGYYATHVPRRGPVPSPRAPPRGVERGTAGTDADGEVEARWNGPMRSEEHTSELQSRFDLVCRLLLVKKKHQ